MTDYKEEQEGELEALESIFVTELEILSDDPIIYNIAIPCEMRNVEGDGPDREFTVGLKFILPDEYPDVPPEIEFSECEELDADLQKSILIELQKCAENEVGCVMIFTLVSELQDKVNEYADNIYNKKLQEKEEKDKVPVFHGTLVTLETFTEWNIKFIKEMNDSKKVKVVSDKLTGRQIFMAKEGNIEIGDNLLGDAEEDVEVDESLFDEELEDEMLEVSDSD